MATARTDSETASKAQALREAADLGCTGAHRHPDGTWMACSTMEEYEKLTASSKTKSGLDLIAETQKIREQKGRRRKRRNRQWEKLRERGVSGIDTLPGGGLVSGKGMTFRPVDGDVDVYDDINQARRRARQLGCIGVARRVSRSGRRVWTPCTNMTDYARATGSTALGRRYQARLERQRIRGIVLEELSRAKRSRRRRKTRLIEEFYDIKSLGRSLRRGAAVFDPKAWDGDGDGLVQEGTPFERPSIPGINTNLPGQPKTRTKPKDYPADSQFNRKRRTEAQKPRRDPNRYRPGKGSARRRGVIDARQAAGLRSISPSKAVNASLDKTYQELVDEGHFKFPTKPHVAGKPIAVAHSAPDLAKLEEIVERGWMRGESPQRRVYFFPEGHESYLDWEGDYAYGFSDPFIDAGVTAQVTPKKPITIFHEDTHGSVDAQIAKQLGISESELKSTLTEQSELVPGTSEVADTARAAKPARGAEHRSPLNLHRAFGVDLFADYTDNEDDGGNGHTLRGNMGSEIIVMDKDIIEVVGVRETGWTEDQIASHGGRRLYRDRNPLGKPDREVLDEDEFQAWRSRTNELASGLRSQRLTQSDLNQRRNRTPKENLSELGEAIDEYVGFLQEHHRHDFAGDGDVISAIDASDPGLVNEHDRLKGRIDDLAGVFEEARADLEEMDFERDELQDEVNRLVRTFDKANGDFLGSHSNSQMQRRQIVRAVRDGQDRDKFLQSEFPDEMAEDQGHMEWLWDTVVEERKEIMQLNKKLGELEDRIKTETLGSEETQETLRSMVQGRIDKHQRPDSSIEIGSGSRALDPDVGMRSRRDALSDTNKQWLRTLQENPGYWDEAPAAVRNVSSDQLRQEAMDLRGSSIRNTGGMRSGGRQKGQEILRKVKPEHTNKPSGERVLYFVGGTTGAGKSTIIKDKKIRLPDSTEAAHIDPDDIKTGLRGWDPKHPGNVHHESRRVTDRVMDDAMNSGMDVVVQGTGKRTEHLRDAKARGYKTSGHFVWIPDREADRRIVQRTAEGGPNIPTHFGSQIAGELRNGDGRFRGLSHDIAEGLYDEFYLWDNTGREPRLIAYRTQDGQFAVHGRKEFDDFFGASGRYVERYWQKNK